MQRKWKRRWQRLTKAILPPVAAGLLFLSAYSPALANPAGGTVVSGSAAITSSGSTMTVNQTTNKAVINWQNFSIDKGETVNFVQPNAGSVALNRVLGSDASNIYGSLNANGKVYLINPNGILFAPGSSVNVGGLVASTLNISDSDFVSGNYTLQKNGSAGSVANQGTITAANEVVLIGPKVSNDGVIAAKVTGLAAGNKVSLDFSGDNLLGVTVDTGAVTGSVSNTGAITATGGLVVMSAGTKDSLLNTVVNNSGVVRAQNVTNVGGVIRLEGNKVTNSGTLDASGKASGQAGGTVKLLGDTVTVKTGSTIDVSGDAGGGTALIGGAYQGGSSEYAATNTTVQTGATINADAITSGNGGTVVVWANDTTNFAGTITAKGGSVSGNGGSVETSGHTLKVSGKVNAGATNGKNGSWLLDPEDLTVDLTTASTIGDSLNNNTDVILQTTSTTASGTGTVSNGNGDITIDAPITWGTGTGTLTLSAYNNINLNSAITATSGGLTLAANTSGIGDGTSTGIIMPAAGSSIHVGTFTLQSGTWREIGSSLSSFYAKDFRISGGTFLRATGGDGTSASPYQITDVYGLQGIGSAGMLSSYYTLANDIDASGTQYWNYDGSTYAGFVPIGTTSSGIFAGSFDGAGYTISGLLIYRPSANYIGLFGVSSGTINNVGLIDGSVTGGYYTGGLVGSNYPTGSITDCYSTETVTGSNSVGGLVGLNTGSIKNSYSTGAVTGSGDAVGGLVGSNKSTGSITASYSRGTVTGGDGSYKIGGLVGSNAGSIENSYSTSSVKGGSSSYYIGGLVGSNDGSITTSYSTGAVTGGSSDIGGLVGLNNGSIATSYSTSAVTGGDGSYYIGGLVGYNNGGIIKNSYSTGAVTGGDNSYIIGGLVGFNGGISSSITNSYSTGAVIGGDSSNSIGGLVGLNYGGNITASYYATTDETGVAINTGSGYSSYGIGKTLAELKDPATFSGWDIAATGGSSAVWRIYSGYTTPLLRSFLTPLTVTVSSTTSTTYDGSVQTVTPAYSTSVDNTLLKGALTYTDQATNTAGEAKNAGTYTVSGSGLYSSQQGYDISYNSGTLTIAPRTLTATQAAAVTKTYDGTNAATFDNSNLTLSGVVAGDSVSVSGTGTYAGKNAGANSVAVTGVTLSNSNYTLTAANINGGSTLTGQIDPKALSAAQAAAVTKTYDGTTAATFDTSNLTLSGVIAGDSVTVSGSGAYAGKDAGASSVTVSSVTLNNSNYTLAAADINGGTLTGQITPKALSAAQATTVTKTYDGTTDATLTAANLTLDTSGVIAGDSVSIVSGTGTYADKNAGASSVAVTGVTLSNSNYTLTAANINGGSTLIGQIDPKALTAAQATAVTKTYDGTNAATFDASNLTLSGVIVGDSVIVSGNGTYAGKDAGASDVTVTGVTLSNSNYTLAAANINGGGTLTGQIDKAALLITASDVTKTYGQTAVLNSYTFSGLVTGDSVTGVVLTSSGADATAKAGKYAITAGGASGSGLGNYNITYADGVLTVQSLTNPAYNGAVSYVDYMAASLPGPFKPYGRPYGLGGASGYQAGVSGSAALLTIVGAGINTGDYLIMNAMEQ